MPAEDVGRWLAERPTAKGLLLAGMPAGSPIMEMPSVGLIPTTWRW